MRYKVTKKDWLFHFVTGLVFFGLGWFWLREEILFGENSIASVCFLWTMLYGAYDLSKPFLSYLVVDDRVLAFKLGLKPRVILLFADIEKVVFGRRTKRMRFYTEDKQYSLTFIYEDMDGFLNRLALHGIEVAGVQQA